MKKARILSLLLVLGGWHVLAQDVADFSGKDLGPLPPGKKYVMEAVFNRFPGVDQQEVLRFAKDHYVETMQQVDTISSRRPNEAVEIMTSAVYEILKLLDIKKSDPQMFKHKLKEMKLEKEAGHYVDRILASEKNEAEELIEKLKNTLNTAFDVKQKIVRLDLEKLEKELSRLKSLVSQREDSRSEIVERRIKSLLGRTAKVKW